MHGHPVADTGWTKCKICYPLQMFGVVLDTELSDNEDGDNCDINIVQ